MVALITTVKVHAAPSTVNNSVEPIPPEAVAAVETVEETERPQEVAIQPVEQPKPVEPPAQPAPVTPPVKPTGSKADWMAAAGIATSDYEYVDYIIQKESSWNPNAVNPNGGGCGLPQALPCSKLGANWSDPVVALKWANNYAVTRYGSWASAYDFWRSNNWW